MFFSWACEVFIVKLLTRWCLFCRRYVKLGDARLLSFQELLEEFQSACIGQCPNTRADLLLVVLLIHSDMSEDTRNKLRKYVKAQVGVNCTLFYSTHNSSEDAVCGIVNLAGTAPCHETYWSESIKFSRP